MPEMGTHRKMNGSKWRLPPRPSPPAFCLYPHCALLTSPREYFIVSGRSETFREYPRRGKHFSSFARVYEEEKKRSERGGENFEITRRPINSAELTPTITDGSNSSRSNPDWARNWLTRIFLFYSLYYPTRKHSYIRYGFSFYCFYWDLIRTTVRRNHH